MFKSNYVSKLPSMKITADLTEPEILSICNQVQLEWSDRPTSRVKQENFAVWFIKQLHNSFRFEFLTGIPMFVSMGRAEKDIYAGVSSRVWKPIVDHFVMFDLVHLHMGFNDKSNKNNSRKSRYQIIEGGSLWNYFLDHYKLHMPMKFIQGYPDILVKDANKKLILNQCVKSDPIVSMINYQNSVHSVRFSFMFKSKIQHHALSQSDLIQSLKAKLNGYNSIYTTTTSNKTNTISNGVDFQNYDPETCNKLIRISTSHDIHYSLELGNTDCYRYTRIFNMRGKRKLGGRYYSLLTNVPKEFRTHLMIDGEATSEFDFSGMHPHLLYSMKGLECPKHPYGGPNGRPERKQAMVTMIGAKNRRVDYKKSSKEIIAKLEEKHEPIKDLFFCDMGIELQKHDSEIATNIMSRFQRETNDCILCYHDGFRAKNKYGDVLIEIMKEEFESYCEREFGYSNPIDIKIVQ